VLFVVAPIVLSALHAPSCGADTPAGGPNAPCTRSSDCENELACLGGFCTSADAASTLPASSHPADAGADGPSGD
jgi:hypothetical protein